MVGRQLRFHFARKRYYISTGYPDTPHHRKLAKLKASEIEKDILFERFDPKDLDKYKSQVDSKEITPFTPSSTPSASQPSLVKLWEKYTDFKRSSLSPFGFATLTGQKLTPPSGLTKHFGKGLY